MEDKQLIYKLQGLKQIKPRKEWVVLAKIEIFKNDNVVFSNTRVPKYNILSLGRALNRLSTLVLGLFYQRRLAYAFAVFLFIFIGLAGIVKYSLPQSVKVTDQSSATLVLSNALKNDVEMFKLKSQSLSELSKSEPENISLALREVKDAAKDLTETIQKDPKLAKMVALEINNNKNYLDISVSDDLDLKKTSDALYEAIDNQMIRDLENMTLTEDQKRVLDKIKDFYKEGKYSAALENILLINSPEDRKN